MLKRILGLVVLSFIISSYDPPRFCLKGVVVDKITSVPIDSALISVGEYFTLFTDSFGGFTIDQMGGSPDFELLIEKKGYEPEILNFSNRNYNSDSTLIKLQATNTVYKPAFNRNQLRIANSLIKITFSLLNILTLIFIFINSEIRWKYIWITGILFINLIFNLLYLDFNLTSYEIIHAPFFMTGYWNNPYTLKIAVPIVSIFFWILYLTKSLSINQDSPAKERSLPK